MSDLGPVQFVVDHTAPWSWDDEDTARNPYIHIYSDDGAVACLHYVTTEERDDYARFAAFVVMLVNERYAPVRPR
jgi:hypothetical protein